MGDTLVGLLNFRGDQYPTNGEVFRYMSSRRGKNNQPMIIREMVSKIHGIWCLGDGFPLDRYHKLMKERKVYLAPLYALTHPRKRFRQVKWNPWAATPMSTHQKGLERVRDM